VCSSDLYDAKADNKTRLFKSGIYSLGNIPETKNSGIFNSTFIEDSVKFTRGMIEDAYNGSLIKPVGLREEYANIEEFSSAHKDQLDVKFSALMNHSPGIYYNFACRTVCDSRYQGLARQRRLLSARGKASPGTAESASTQLRKHAVENLNPWILKKPYYAYYLDLKIKEIRRKNMQGQRKKKLQSMVAENKNYKKSLKAEKRKGVKAAKSHTRRRFQSHRTTKATMDVNNP
jgi:hypothetical protein